MKKLILLSLSFIFLCSVFMFKTTEPVFAASNEDFIIRAYGDSISHGEALQDLNDAYPAVFSQKYIENFQAEFIPKGVSGDKTSDLLSDLQPYINKTAADQQSFEDTDIILLCIGANNVLGPAVSNLAGFLTGSVTEEQYQALLDNGVSTFKQEYPQILNAFESKKVVVMTVYNPYKHLTLNDIQIDPAIGMFESTIKSAIASYDAKFQQMLGMSMEALQIINEDIRNSAGENVQVVDIWNLFETFNKTQYLEYINADISNLTIDSSDISYIIQGNLIPLMGEITANCDPHPSKQGHEIIAQQHINKFKLFNLSSNKNMAQINKNDTITFSVDSIVSEDVTYKFYKKAGNVSELIAESNNNLIEIEAKDLEGSNKIYAEIYVNSQKFETTEEMSFSFSNENSAVSNPWNTQTSQKNIKPYIYAALVGVPLIGIVIYFIAKRKRDF